MIRKKIFSTITYLILAANFLFAQENELEIFIIDAFVTPEKPHTFKLSFFTSKEVVSEILIDNEYRLKISEQFIEDHSAKIDFTEFDFSNKFIPYKIICENKNGEITESENFELILPYEEFIETKEGDDPISTILFGMLLYILPSPNMLIIESENYFSLSKELPIITFYSSGYNYPSASISLEYTHIYESDIYNYLRVGYKHFIPIDVIEYVSPGLTGFTNFNGNNGLGLETSIGLFKVYDIFTFYSRYRYNISLDETKINFHEISIGLYSHFFTIDL